jgi:hypothetical protein
MIIFDFACYDHVLQILFMVLEIEIDSVFGASIQRAINEKNSSVNCYIGPNNDVSNISKINLVSNQVSM